MSPQRAPPQRTDSVDALQMSSHGNPTSFLVWGGSVTTGDAIDFGKSDLEFFATHACDLLEHTATNSVGRWIPAFQRLHYMLGFHTSSFSGGGQSSRGQWFAMYAAWFFYGPLSWLFRIDMPIREAWAEATRSPRVNVAIPETLADVLKATAKARGVRTSVLVREALARYLDPS